MIRNTLLTGIVAIIGIIAGCSEVKTEYPQIIVDNQLEEQFDVAKFEAYKIIGGVNCNCMGVSNSNNQKHVKDSFNLLTLDLFLVSLDIKNDTIIYFMDFYTKDENTQMKQTTTLSKSYGDFFDIIGIGFLKKSTRRFIAYIDDKGVIDFIDLHHNQLRDSTFLACLKHGTKINRWLQSYLKQRKIK